MVLPSPAPPPEPAFTRSGSIAKNTGFLLAAQFLRNAGPLLILFLLARLTTQETVGTYSLALAIVTPFFVLAQLGMRTVTLTLEPEARFKGYTIVQAVAAAAALVAAVTFGSLTTSLLAVVLLLAGLSKVSDAFSDFLSGPLQRHGQARTVFAASLIAAVAVSLSTGIVLFVTRELVPTLLALASSSLIATWICLFRPARRTSLRAESAALYPRPIRNELRRIVLAGLPLGLSMSLMSLISTVPQYLVTSSLGEAETARLAVLLYVYALADIVTGVLSQAWIPHAQREIQHDHDKIGLLTVTMRGATKWTLFYVPLTAAGMVLAWLLIPTVFGAAYTISLGEAIPLALAIILLPAAHFTATAVAIRNDYAHTLTLAIGSTALSLLTSLVLIPRIGLAGAFWGLLVAVAVRCGLAFAILVVRGRGGGGPS